MNMMDDQVQVALFKREGIDFELLMTEASEQMDEEFAVFSTHWILV